MTGGAESDVVEGVNDLTGTTSSQELVPPLEGSSTADLQVVGAPKNHVLGSAGADPVQLQSVGTGEQVTPDTDPGAHRDEQDTPLAPTGNDENRQLRTELEAVRTTMKATDERHGKEIAKLKTLVNANVQSEPRAVNADVNALPDARPMHRGDEEDLSLSDNEHASLDFTEPFQWRKNAWHCSSISSSHDACQVRGAGLMASSRSLLAKGGKGFSRKKSSFGQFTPEVIARVNKAKLNARLNWDGKTCFKVDPRTSSSMFKSCKTCMNQEYNDCTSCAEGTFLAAQKFTEKKGKKVTSGRCLALPELKDFKPSSGDPLQPTLGGVNCRYSQCTDGTTGSILGGNTTDKSVCSRICLMGGYLTRVKNLRRYDNPERKTGERTVDSKFGLTRFDTISSPVCALHKTTMCTKNKAFHTGNCEKFRKEQDGGKAEHCRQYNCDVQKEVSCVAIFPHYQNHQPLTDVTKQLGTNLSAYMNECKHAINPCGTLPMLV